MQISFEVPKGAKCSGFGQNGCPAPAKAVMWTGPKTHFNLCRPCLHSWIDSQMGAMTDTVKMVPSDMAGVFAEVVPVREVKLTEAPTESPPEFPPGNYSLIPCDKTADGLCPVCSSKLRWIGSAPWWVMWFCPKCGVKPATQAPAAPTIPPPLPAWQQKILDTYTQVPFAAGLDFSEVKFTTKVNAADFKPKKKRRRSRDRHYQGRWYAVVHYESKAREAPWRVVGFFQSVKLATIWLETCREYLGNQPGLKVLPGTRVMAADVLATLIEAKSPAETPDYVDLEGWEQSGKDGLTYGGE